MREEDISKDLNSVMNEIKTLKSKSRQNVNNNFMHLGNVKIFVLKPNNK